MSAKKFLFYRLLVVFLLAFVISVSISFGNYTVPIAAIILGMVILITLKKRVGEVLNDERDYKLAGDAARYAITGFALIVVLVSFILLSFKEANANYGLISSLLSYSVCLLMIFYSFIFKFLKIKEANSDKKIFFIIKKSWLILLLGFIFSAIFILGSLRIFSGEDGWVCSNGQWIKHGNPDSFMPTRSCNK